MKYDLNTSITEISMRAGNIQRKKHRRNTGILSGTSALLTLCLITLVYDFGGLGIPKTEGEVYGAYMLSGTIGGYVLAGVISFALGVTVTLLCISSRNKSERIDSRKGE